MTNDEGNAPASPPTPAEPAPKAPQTTEATPAPAIQAKSDPFSEAKAAPDLEYLMLREDGAQYAVAPVPPPKQQPDDRDTREK